MMLLWGVGLGLPLYFTAMYNVLYKTSRPNRWIPLAVSITTHLALLAILT